MKNTVKRNICGEFVYIYNFMRNIIPIMLVIISLEQFFFFCESFLTYEKGVSHPTDHDFYVQDFQDATLSSKILNQASIVRFIITYLYCILAKHVSIAGLSLQLCFVLTDAFTSMHAYGCYGLLKILQAKFFPQRSAPAYSMISALKSYGTIPATALALAPVPSAIERASSSARIK